MADNILCPTNIVILLAVLLVVGIVYYYNSCARKERYTHSSLLASNVVNPPTVNGTGAIDNPLAGYNGPADYNFFNENSKGVSDYDMFFNNGNNVLNQRAGEVASVPDAVKPESCNAQCQRNHRLRRNMGLSRAVADLPPMDLFGTTVAEPIFFNRMTGKPIQSLYNNPADQRAGMIDRLNRIGNFETPGYDQIGDVPNTSAPLPSTATTTFNPNTGTISVSDSREILM